MATLEASINAFNVMNAKPRMPKIIRCYKTKQELGISASSDEFFYVRFPVKRLSLAASTRRDSEEIIIDVNAHKVGKTFGGFIPKVFIVRGHNKVANLRAQDSQYTNLWIGAQALKKLDIKADDAISLNDLQEKLRILLSKNYPSNGSMGLDTPNGYAWIRDVYPFENYFIFSRQGNLYKQQYILDPMMREAALSGKPVKVYEEFSETPKGLTSPAGQKAKVAESVISSAIGLPIIASGQGAANYVRTLSQQHAFDKINTGDTALGAHLGSDTFTQGVVTNFGPETSELNNPPIRTMMNIEEALQMYLFDIAEGVHKPVGQQPACGMSNGLRASRDYSFAVKEAEIAAKGVSQKIDVHDFIKWQNKILTSSASKMTKFGEGFLFYGEGERDDPSTWVKAAGNPNSGFSKFKVGSRVKSPHGKGTITAKVNKDIVEVTHHKGKKARFSLKELEAR